MPGRSSDVTLSARQNAHLRSRLHRLMAQRGLTARSLAQRSQLSIGTIRSVGQTAGGPTLGTLLALVRALDLNSLDQLLGPSASTLVDHHDELGISVGTENLQAVLGVDVRSDPRG